jgi:hypothetical protein
MPEREADADVAAQAKSYFDQLAADRKLLTVPAEGKDAAKLTTHYANDAPRRTETTGDWSLRSQS